MFENHKKESPILGIAGFGGGAAWAVLKAVVSAISDAAIEAVGGATTFSHDDGYTYHVFTEDGTFDVQTLSGPASLEFFAVGGGGAGGADDNQQTGGGGAGGYLTGVSGITTTGSFPITVGVGGTWIGPTTEFSVGTATTISFLGGTQVSGFGGHGGVENVQPPEGGLVAAGQSVSLGSGGGGGWDGTTGRPGGSGGPQGNPGGNNSTPVDDGAGGGGGAGSAGQDGDLSGNTSGGHGGFGKISNFHVLSSVGYGGAAPGGSTPNAWFAGGGGGAVDKGGQNAPGGGSALYVGRSATRADAEGLTDISNTGILWNSGPFAGAGAGLDAPIAGVDSSKHATANTGSGGGGVTNTPAANPAGSGDGAPGIAVIRYQNGSPIYGGNNAYYTPEGKKVFVFTESGTLVNNDPTITSADYFLVGGGGGGSCDVDSGGGGGAGGLLTGIGQPIEVATYNITVGTGGTSVSGFYGEHGTDTVALGLTAFGGGGGNGSGGLGGINPLPFGGSGGGGTSQGGAAGTGNAAGSPQGNAGGDGDSGAAGGGGGGAGGSGGTADFGNNDAGEGGIGVQAPAAFRSPFWTYGDPGNGGWWFAGGGGGGSDGFGSITHTGIGGTGGGGDGGTRNSSTSIAKDALFGTGGGGGGGGDLLPNAPGIPERSGTGGPGIALISVDAPEVKAIGGDYIYSTDTHIVHIFTQPGILTATSGISETTSVLVAGGGGGGGGQNNYAGGGGAGGYRDLSTGTLPISSYPVTVGTGGAGDTTGSTGAPGTDSVFNGFTAAGGGGGGGSSTNAADGGSGGGSKNGAAGSGNTPPVSPPQGNPGTTGGSNTGGGGGGATSAATSSDNAAGTGGSGGDGAQAPSIFRSSVYSFGTPGPQPGGFYFAGGGGGAGSVTAGLGGYGGGGDGQLGDIATVAGTAGQTNTGGGGGGGGTTPGYDGAPGIVMISYSKTNANVASLREAGSITQGSSGDNVSLVLNKPSQTQEGDIMIAFGNDKTNGETSWSMASGWTQIASDSTFSSSNIFVAYKVAGSSEPSSYTFTSNTASGNNNMSGVIVTYDGAFDVIGTLGTGNSSGVQTAPGITVSENNSVLLAWFTDDEGNRSWSNQTSGLTEVVADDTSNGGPSWVLYQDAISAGASGNRQATCSISTDGDFAVLIALKPKP